MNFICQGKFDEKFSFTDAIISLPMFICRIFVTSNLLRVNAICLAKFLCCSDLTKKLCSSSPILKVLSTYKARVGKKILRH